MLGMSHFDKLEKQTTDLPIGLCSKQSIIKSSTFDAFRTIVFGDETQKLWRNLIYYQIYPDPQYFQNIESYVSDIAKTEPGEGMDYEYIRSSFLKVQSKIHVSKDFKKRIFDVGSNLVKTHVDYVYATIHVAVFEMYDWVIDCFYGKIRDRQFEQFVSSHITNGINIGSNWPSYEYVKHHNTLSLTAWLRNQSIAANEVLMMKKSASTRALLVTLRPVQEAHNPFRLDINGEPFTEDMSDSHEPGYSRIALIQRHNEIEKRNLVASNTRVIKHCRLKSYNLHNVHQLGEQGRQVVHDSIVQSIHAIQELWKDRLFEEDDTKDEDENPVVNDMSLKTKGLHFAAGVASNGEEEPLDGIIIPNGFVNVASNPATYF